MAVDGVSININIPCTGLGLNVAPFWAINGSVHELFNIPWSFPYAEVDSFTGLTIPVVTSDLDGIMFQCATFNENGRTMLGSGTRLRVHPGRVLEACSLKIILMRYGLRGSFTELCFYCRQFSSDGEDLGLNVQKREPPLKFLDLALGARV